MIISVFIYWDPRYLNEDLPFPQAARLEVAQVNWLSLSEGTALPKQNKFCKLTKVSIPLLLFARNVDQEIIDNFEKWQHHYALTILVSIISIFQGAGTFHIHLLEILQSLANLKATDQKNTWNKKTFDIQWKSHHYKRR